MLVAAHKPADFPQSDFYLPIHVGHAASDSDFGCQPDDDGDNISTLNPSFCELTATYWAWKNLDCPIIGLSHYRRYFLGDMPGPNGTHILSGAEAETLLKSADVVLSKPRHYVIETIQQHYSHAHVPSDLDTLRAIISSETPEMLGAYDHVFAQRKLSLYNMFLMRRDSFEDYASWIFTILKLAEEQIDITDRTSYQKRVFGYLGERLLNVWVASRKDLVTRTRKVVNTEGEPKFQKAEKMVLRKITKQQFR